MLLARFDLGDKAPQINGIKVYQGDRIEDEVNLEIDVMWSGKQARHTTLGYLTHRHARGAAHYLTACAEACWQCTLIIAHKSYFFISSRCHAGRPDGASAIRVLGRAQPLVRSEEHGQDAVQAPDVTADEFIGSPGPESSGVAHRTCSWRCSCCRCQGSWAR